MSAEAKGDSGQIEATISVSEDLVTFTFADPLGMFEVQAAMTTQLIQAGAESTLEDVDPKVDEFDKLISNLGRLIGELTEHAAEHPEDFEATA